MLGGAVDASNHLLYATGFLSSARAMFGRWLPSNSQTNGQGFCLVKYDGTGEVLWAKAIRTSRNPHRPLGCGVRMPAGNCYGDG